MTEEPVCSDYVCLSVYYSPFAKILKPTVTSLIFVCLSVRHSVRPNVTPQVPLEECSLNFIYFRILRKLSRKNTLIRIRQG